MIYIYSTVTWQRYIGHHDKLIKNKRSKKIFAKLNNDQKETINQKKGQNILTDPC